MAIAHDRSAGTTASTRGDPARGRGATRSRLIAAGWDLIDRVGLLEALQTISVADIAEGAGRSERTFWNHFATWEAYVEALASNIPRRGPMEDDGGYGAVDAVDEALVPAAREVFGDLVRAAAQANWHEVTQDAELRAFRRQLFLASRSDPENRLAEVLGRDYYGSYLPRLQQIYEHFGAAVDAGPIEPFDFEDLTRILAALSEGLVLQYIAAPQRITPEFVADATTAVALGLIATRDSGFGLGSLSARMAFTPAPLQADPALAQDARRCGELVEHRRSALTWADVARTIGTSEAAARNAFQRVEVVAALSFGPADLAGTRSGIGDDFDQELRRRLAAVDCLCELVRTARAGPWAASRLLAERTAGGEDAATIRGLVPLGAALARTMDEDAAAIHELVVDATLCIALAEQTTSPAAAAEAALALHGHLAR